MRTKTSKSLRSYVVTIAQRSPHPTVVGVHSFEEAIRLRNECSKHGLPVQTGVCSSTRERCQIYRDRLREYHERQEAKRQAMLNLQER